MTEQHKIFRIFNLIARLRGPVGSSKTALANDMGVSIRTIERYFNLIESLGFELDKNKERYQIKRVQNKHLEMEDAIVFTLEEASFIRDSVLNHSQSHLLKKSLLQKLYALTELEEISDDIRVLHHSKNISKIRSAIKQQKQAVLKNYNSVNSHSEKDRLIEPIRFIQYFRYLIAFDVETQKIKSYKTDRFSKAQILDKDWQYASKHTDTSIDLFGMSGQDKIPVKLRLSQRAEKLMTEEFPGSEKWMHSKNGQTIFSGFVRSPKGIGRFILGLIDEIEILEPKLLKDYIREKVKKFHLRQ